MPIPETGGDIWSLKELGWEIATVCSALVVTGAIAVTKRAFGKIDKLEKGLIACNEKHPSKEYMELQKEFMNSRFKNLEDGQESINDKLDVLTERRKEGRDN